MNTGKIRRAIRILDMVTTSGLTAWFLFTTLAGINWLFGGYSPRWVYFVICFGSYSLTLLNLLERRLREKVRES